MARPTDCIFCGAATGSREHSFPAGLGGRRSNKGILCGECNERFSDLDGKLISQLAIINGLIGVRSDHLGEPRKALLTDTSTGESLQVDGSGRPSLPSPKVVADEIVDGQRHMHMRFSSERQVQEWREEMTAQGLTPKVVNRVESQQLRPSGIHNAWSFGGADTLREIGRIALNFLAQHRPELARHPGLQGFKNYVRDGGSGDFVWYDFDTDISGLTENPFTFGHRVLIGLDVASGAIYARVSLFSAFDFAVWFGAVAPDETATIIVDIDPLAEHPPQDIKVHPFSGQALVPVRLPKPERDESVNMRNRFANLLQRIENKHWAETSADLLPKLNAARDLTGLKRGRAVADLLVDHRQRVLNLMTHCVTMLREEFRENPDLLRVLGLLDHFVQEDERSLTGLSQAANSTVEIVRHKLADRLSAELDNGVLSDETLRWFLQGTHGVAIAGEVMMDFIKNALAGARVRQDV